MRWKAPRSGWSIAIVTIALSASCAGPLDRRLADANQAVADLRQTDGAHHASALLDRAADLLVLARSERAHRAESWWIVGWDGRSRTLLAEVETTLRESRVAIDRGRDRAERDALRALSEARLAVGRVAMSMEHVPTGVDTAADTEVMREDLRRLRRLLGAAETAFERRELGTARDTARQVARQAHETATIIRRAVAYLPAGASPAASPSRGG